VDSGSSDGRANGAVPGQSGDGGGSDRGGTGVVLTAVEERDGVVPRHGDGMEVVGVASSKRAREILEA
jgi:hypothetical protein